MKTKSFITLFLFGSLLPFSVAVAMSASTVEKQQQFYNKSKEGWFWYHDPVIAPDPKEDKDKQEQKQKQKIRSVPSLKDYTVQKIWNMYPDDFQQLLNVLQKKAVQYPTEQNIKEYLTMQDIARRKAAAYASATQYVTQKYADLYSINSVYPVTTPGVTARTTMQKKEIFQTITNARASYALIFFMQPGCGFCEKQAGILAYFKDRYNWPIKSVNIRQNVAAAERFNVTVTPTLLLVKKGSDRYLQVSSGVIAFSKLERNIFRAVRFMEGKVQPHNYRLYDYQKGSPLDPDSILKKGPQPWEQVQSQTR